MSRLKILNGLGEEINLSSFELVGLKLKIPSPSYRRTIENLDGQAGGLVTEEILKSRMLTAELFIKALTYTDSLQIRDALYNIFGSGQILYFIESFQPTKRWKVRVEDWEPERINGQISKVEIPLFVESGASESVNVIQKSFNSSTFRFKNEGNLLIDPRIHSETEIEFTGASSNLIIRNLTTGDEWSWNGGTVEGNTILLKGVRSLKNNASIFGQTNKKLITLLPGWNDLEVVGATGDFELTIRSRFYFL